MHPFSTVALIALWFMAGLASACSPAMIGSTQDVFEDQQAGYFVALVGVFQGDRFVIETIHDDGLLPGQSHDLNSGDKVLPISAFPAGNVCEPSIHPHLAPPGREGRLAIIFAWPQPVLSVNDALYIESPDLVRPAVRAGQAIFTSGYGSHIWILDEAGQSFVAVPGPHDYFLREPLAPIPLARVQAWRSN